MWSTLEYNTIFITSTTGSGVEHLDDFQPWAFRHHGEFFKNYFIISNLEYWSIVVRKIFCLSCETKKFYIKIWDISNFCFLSKQKVYGILTLGARIVHHSKWSFFRNSIKNLFLKLTQFGLDIWKLHYLSSQKQLLDLEISARLLHQRAPK